MIKDSIFTCSVCNWECHRTGQVDGGKTEKTVEYRCRIYARPRCWKCNAVAEEWTGLGWWDRLQELYLYRDGTGDPLKYPPSLAPSHTGLQLRARIRQGQSI